MVIGKKTLGLVSLMAVCVSRLGWGATYYVSTHGNDERSGLSRPEAWRSAERVNQQQFSPGDRILFEAGQDFDGPVRLDEDDSGTAKEPVVLGSYDGETDLSSQRATIQAREERGIDICNTSGLEIRGLNVAGSGAKTNRRSGIIAYTTPGKSAHHLTIENVEISGFGKHGISIGAWHNETGYRNVRIAHCETHDNWRTGIITWGPWGLGTYAHKDLYIGYSRAFHMRGGSGIALASVDGGVVEHTIAFENGEEISGAVGIWAWDSNDIVFQFNESFGNRTTRVDGDGFDFDGGVTNSVMQYNYSHDNDAAGFLLAQYENAPFAMENIVIRYNISENDCRKKPYGAIHLWNNEDKERLKGIQIYQNTIYLTSAENNEPTAINIVSSTTNVSVWNNLFFTAGNEAIVSVVPDQNGILFVNNAYWSGKNCFRVNWMGENYHSLAEWLAVARDQERQGGDIVALNTDPLLRAPGTGGTLDRTDRLNSLRGYQLREDSPLINRGLDSRSVFGVDPGTQGFFGGEISDADPPAIGAHSPQTAL